MWSLLWTLACSSPPPPKAPAEPPPPPKAGLNVAKASASFASSVRKLPLEVLLTGDPSYFGVYVDAGEVWVDVSLGGMVIDEAGRVVTKADGANTVRSIGLRGIDAAHVLEEKPDPNSEGNVLKRVRAVGKYSGCEAGTAGSTVCYVDVGDPPPGYNDAPVDNTIRPGVTTVPVAAPPPPAAYRSRRTMTVSRMNRGSGVGKSRV